MLPAQDSTSALYRSFPLDELRVLQRVFELEFLTTSEPPARVFLSRRLGLIEEILEDAAARRRYR